MRRRTFLKQALVGGSALPFCWRLAGENSPAVADKTKFILGAPVTHSDWMLHPTGVKWGPEGVRHMLDACKACGWSRVHWRVFDGGRSLYKSKLLRAMGKWEQDSFWSPQAAADKELVRTYTGMSEAQRAELMKKFDALDYSTFDPLAEAVRYGHKIGLQIHAWASVNEDDHGWGLQSEFAKKHPEFRWRGRKGKVYHSQLSFAHPEVHKYKLALLKELIENYDLDGFFLDWIRTGDVRDNPQTDSEGVADYNYDKPLVERFRKKHRKDPETISNGDEAWVRFRAEPQTEFMRDVRKLLKKKRLPISVLVGHPWHYRGLMNKINGNLRGLLLDVKSWAREGLIDSAVAAGYYRDGGNAESAFHALQKETEGKVDVWTFAWVPSNATEADATFATAEKVGAKQILFWEADYIEAKPNAAELKQKMSERAAS